jgi:hypothetical protein
VGSGTCSRDGVKNRFGQYLSGTILPVYVNKSIEEGYSIQHMGLLCWIDLPTAGLVLHIRLVFLAMEAAFAYIFWAMRTVNDSNDYGMRHICPWDRNSLEYDGLCSHCCLDEAIPRSKDYDLSAEELEKLNEEKMLKRKADAHDYFVEYTAMRLANDPEEWRGSRAERQREYRAADPERNRETENKRRRETVESKEFYCELCKISLDSAYALNHHNEKSVKHSKRAEYLQKPHVCTVCNWGCDRLGNYNQHLNSVRHKKMVSEAAKSAQDASQLSSELN